MNLLLMPKKYWVKVNNQAKAKNATSRQCAQTITGCNYLHSGAQNIYPARESNAIFIHAALGRPEVPTNSDATTPFTDVMSFDNIVRFSVSETVRGHTSMTSAMFGGEASPKRR